MRNQRIKLIAIFIIVLATAFVFKGTTDNNVKLTASGLNYITAEQNQYGLTKEQQAALESGWQDLKASWNELISQFKKTDLYDYFKNWQLSNPTGSFSSDEIKTALEDAFGGLKF